MSSRLKHLRSSAGIAVFAGAKKHEAPWVAVASMRPKFAETVGRGRARPDGVIRCGRGPTLPRSLRRPVQAVLVCNGLAATQVA